MQLKLIPNVSLGDLQLGMTISEVLELLGEPNEIYIHDFPRGEKK